jgi:hypothetical protein
MKRTGLSDYQRRILWLTGVAVAFASAHQSAPAQIFEINTARLSAQHLRVDFQSDTNFYFILRRGSSPQNIAQAVAIALGTNGNAAISDPALATNSAAFFRLQKISLLSPLDTDQDGIDDVWELRFRQAGAALNGADANADQNGNGVADAVDYANYLAAQAPLATLATAGSQFSDTAGTVGVQVLFSKPYSGTLHFQISGTAVQGLDYQPAFGPLDASSGGEIPVNGTSANIPIALLTNTAVNVSRALVISLRQPSGVPSMGSYTLGALTTHVLKIVDGDLGTFGGVIQFTNAAGLTPQTIRLALRSGSSTTGSALLDTASSPFFKRKPLLVPVQFGGDGRTITAWGPVSGTTISTNVSGQVLQTAWSLELGAPTLQSKTLSAPVTLRVTGLSASGRSVQAQGTLTMNDLE